MTSDRASQVGNTGTIASVRLRADTRSCRESKVPRCVRRLPTRGVLAFPTDENLKSLRIECGWSGGCSMTPASNMEFV